MVEPIFEKINYSQKLTELKEQIKVEVKSDVKREQVQSVLSITPYLISGENEVSQGKVSYGGRITFYISYIDTDGELKKCECGSEFFGSSNGDGINETHHATTTIVVERVECDTSGAYLTVTAYLGATAKITYNEQIEALVGGEELVVKESEINCLKSLGIKRGVYPLEEEFEVGYPIKEVLFHRADGVVTAVQSGVGSIIVDGEALLSLVLLQNNDKNDIIRENKVLPFRMEIECEEAMPNLQATAKVREKSFKTDISVDEQTGKSLITVSVNLAFEGEAFADNCTTIATDAFSTSSDLQLKYENVPYYKACDLRHYTTIASGRCEINELTIGSTVLAVGGEKATVVSATCSQDGIVVTGLLSAVAYMRDEENKVFVRKLEIPFEKTLEGSFSCDTSLDVVLKAERASAKIISLNQMELESELFITVYPEERCEHKVVKEVTVLGEKEQNTSAISVFIPEDGEQLWSLAKRLNINPEQLLETNKDLEFPLSGRERIVIFRRR